MKTICDEIKKIEYIDIQKIEKLYGLKFSDDFSEFFLMNNGGIPKKPICVVDGEEYEVRSFLAFGDDEYYSIKKPIDYFQKHTNGKIIPFAVDSGGNYFCLNVENKKVYFWSHDDDLYYFLCDSFAKFIDFLI